MKILAIVNQKGGAGKTTLALNLCGVLVESNQRPLLLDADPQKSAARWALRRERGASPPVHALPVASEQDAGQFAAALRRLASERDANRVLIDCPPGHQVAALVALMVADLALIPVTASPIDLWAVEETLRLVGEARETRGDGRPRIALVPSRLIPRTVMARELPEVLGDFGQPVAPAISQRIALVESAIMGKTIGEYAPGSKGHEEFSELARYTERALAE